MLKFDAVHISPNGKEGGNERVEAGLYLWPHYQRQDGEASDISSLHHLKRQTGYNVLPLGTHKFDDIRDLQSSLEHGCRFAAPARQVVRPPETTRLDVEACDRDTCIELRALNEKAVCSVSPVSGQEARGIIFSVAAINSEKNK